MTLHVTVKTKARQNSVEKIDATHFKVAVKAMPIENKANLAVIKALADYFNLPKSEIILVSGEKSKNKVFEVEKGA